MNKLRTKENQNKETIKDSLLNKMIMFHLNKYLQCQCIVILVLLFCCNISSRAETKQQKNQKLIYLNLERMEIAKERIKAQDPLYVKAYDSIIILANKELKAKIDPVTNKTVMPTSGDKHDFHTLGSYYWPDPTKKDGLPWIYKDGEFNPINRGPKTDYDRLHDLFSSLHTLNLAYYFSGDKKYILKARKIVQVWFIDNKTKVNPNVNFGKAIPGKVSGTNFAIIDWTDIGKVITTIQLLEMNKFWEENDKTIMDKWFNDYYKWLTESEFGLLESSRSNNHGTNYDYQLLGIMIYLGKLDEAHAKFEKVKKTRIASQIEKDGSQPLELARTKSVNYSVNNLWALARITDLGFRFSNVDLWNFHTEKGADLEKAYKFMIPYITDKDTWKWKQITGGGSKKQLKNMALPMIRRSELMLGKKILPEAMGGYDKFDPQDILIYAP